MRRYEDEIRQILLNSDDEEELVDAGVRTSYMWE